MIPKIFFQFSQAFYLNVKLYELRDSTFKRGHLSFEQISVQLTFPCNFTTQVSLKRLLHVDGNM
jgi:hypothetical protein